MIRNTLRDQGKRRREAEREREKEIRDDGERVREGIIMMEETEEKRVHAFTFPFSLSFLIRFAAAATRFLAMTDQLQRHDATRERERDGRQAAGDRKGDLSLDQGSRL